MKKPIPSGIDDFKKLVKKGYYFVDKTMLIDEILTDMAEVTLYTRPRRFGKTLNMSMMKYFFDIRNSSENRALFNGLKIEKTRHMEKFGKYLVISISLKSIIARNKEDFDEDIKSLIYDVYNSFDLDKEKMKEENLNLYNQYIRETSIGKYKKSLKYLCKILHDYYKEKVIVLIDEYDAPIINALNSKDENFIKEVLKFMRSLFSATLKDNEYLEFAIVTGILRITGQGLFSGFNNVKHRSITSEDTNEFYGFTEEEVKEALAYYELSDTFSGVKAWYDGYNFGGKEIYNPWSIINYLGDKKLKSYWTQTATNELIVSLMSKFDDDKRKEFQSLLEKSTITINYDDNYDIELLKNPNAVWELLLYAGYLTIEKFADDEIKVRVVNYEVLRALKQIYARTMNLPGANEVLNAIINEDVDKLYRLLNNILKVSVSYYDLTSENSLHMLVLGILIATKTSYEITSNKESGKGRYDILIRHKESDKVYVVELKKDDSLESAFTQMKKKEYGKGYSDVTYVAIVHNGKEVLVDMKKSI